MTTTQLYKLHYFVPESDLETTKQALFAAGAGKLGNYEQCCWQTKGQGQFKPSAESNPTIGEKETLCTLEEFKVEVQISEAVLRPVIAALKQSHPYEEPAFEVIALESIV